MVTIEVKSEEAMISFGRNIGRFLDGGEIIELLGDVGSGKTMLVKGIADGLGVHEYVQSPSFTINRIYKGRDDIVLSHYDFYRLENAGIMINELAEVVNDTKTVTVIEWADVIKGVLPKDRLSVFIKTLSENTRELAFCYGGTISRKLEGQLVK